MIKKFEFMPTVEWLNMAPCRFMHTTVRYRERRKPTLRFSEDLEGFYIVHYTLGHFNYRWHKYPQIFNQKGEIQNKK